MIDTVFNLIAILMWVGSIFCFVGGGFVCVSNIINGSWGERSKSIIALVLGVGAFVLVYRWMESLLWSMLAAGCVFLSVTEGKTSGGGSPEPRPEPGDGILEAYIKQKMMEDAITNALNKHKRGF